MTNNEHEQRLVKVNRTGAESVERSAAQQRGELINVAFAGLLAYATRQQDIMAELEAQGKLGEAPFDRTVLLALARLPFIGDKPQAALSLRLEPDRNLGQEPRGKEKMMVFIPVSADVVLDLSFDPDTLERPDFIVIDRYDEEGRVRSYKISDNAAEEFQSAFHGGEQLVGEEFELLQLGFRASRRVKPADAIVGVMMTELTDWTAQVQRSDAPDMGHNT